MERLRTRHAAWLAEDGDRGLDAAPTWGRTYWGGAMFCLLADVQMRQRSDRRVGLQHALRTADAAVCQTTLAQLYALMKDCPRMVDPAAMWKDLGVTLEEGGAVALRDEAPLAGVRRAILG